MPEIETRKIIAFDRGKRIRKGIIACYKEGYKAPEIKMVFFEAGGIASARILLRAHRDMFVVLFTQDASSRAIAKKLRLLMEKEGIFPNFFFPLPAQRA